MRKLFRLLLLLLLQPKWYGDVVAVEGVVVDLELFLVNRPIHHVGTVLTELLEFNVFAVSSFCRNNVLTAPVFIRPTNTPLEILIKSWAKVRLGHYDRLRVHRTRLLIPTCIQVTS